MGLAHLKNLTTKLNVSSSVGSNQQLSQPVVKVR
ncbi:hypothetical protein FAES_5447 [Fibrella aestuarina BUZ 2]|uniref:Uncharacterized protein n=1 Tax=Fibrella aestuarina BUZ 2 TaxID=1166018 RepID=I0KH43_9BACT|nr:hypothetical protein FAES_5447 [Fibrella aestuarina BUZ 2]